MCLRAYGYESILYDSLYDNGEENWDTIGHK